MQQVIVEQLKVYKYREVKPTLIKKGKGMLSENETTEI